jgi:hypothetical protein
MKFDIIVVGSGPRAAGYDIRGALFETARPRYVAKEAADGVVGGSMSLTRTQRL